MEGQEVVVELDEKLKSFVDRIERLEHEKKTVSADISEVYRQLVDEGYDRAAVAELIKIRKKDPDEVEQQNEIIDLYAKKIGMGD